MRRLSPPSLALSLCAALALQLGSGIVAAGTLSGLPSLSLHDLPPPGAGRAGAGATTTATATASADMGNPGIVPRNPQLSTSLSPISSGSSGAQRKRQAAPVDDAPTGARIAPRVLVITMFEPETQVWLDHMGPWRHTRIAGLSAEFPLIHCNAAQVCVVTTGMGHSNAATSVMALVLSRQLDLRLSYILVTGIAAINPELGTLGSPAWARYLVDFGLQWQLDSREAPAGWPTGYLGINTRSPSEKPPLDYHTEVYRLNENLLQKALGLSRGITLVDEPKARAARAIYPNAPANQPPQVLQCDSVSSDTWFAGPRLGERATAWASLLTDGQANYCTNQQEDNATFEALQRGAQLKRLRLTRVLMLRAGSDFDRPPPGGSAASNLLDYTGQGGFDLALENMYRAARPVVLDITRRWPKWRDNGPPKD